MRRRGRRPVRRRGDEQGGQAPVPEAVPRRRAEAVPVPDRTHRRRVQAAVTQGEAERVTRRDVEPVGAPVRTAGERPGGRRAVPAPPRERRERGAGGDVQWAPLAPARARGRGWGMRLRPRGRFFCLSSTTRHHRHRHYQVKK